MSTQTKMCEACGANVTYIGHRGFGDYHRSVCPKKGTNAADADHPACPSHGSLVWVVGPYSTFRACASQTCTAGKRGKPYRICAPRGEHSDAASEPKSSTPPNTFRTAFDDPQPFPFKRQPLPTNDKDTEVNTDSTPTTTPTEHTLSMYGALGDAVQRYVDDHSTQLSNVLARMQADAIAEALKGYKPTGPAQVEWHVNGQPFAKIDGAHHKALPRLLKLYAAGFRNFLIVGPAGSGKTTLAHDLSRALNTARGEDRPFGQVSCTSGMPESSLTGRAIPDLTTGKVVFQTTDFVSCYESGGVFLLDEVDAADPNVMLVINSALANGHMPLPNRVDSPLAARHADAAIVCAANTWGQGADRQYVGRNQLDAAFLDRFVGTTIEVDYDRDLEASLVGDDTICARVWSIRDKARDLKLRRIVGTRFLLSVTRLVKSAEESLDAALLACTTGWTDDERSRVGVRS